MKLKDFYDVCVQEGIRADLRTKPQLKKFLSEKRKKFRSLKGLEKKFFDKEELTNPYGDTRILYGNHNKEIKRVMVGIDIDAGELLLADHLSKTDKPIDLVLAHHPKGLALALLSEVMHLQADVLSNLGLKEKVAQDLVSRRILDVARSIHSVNHTRVEDAAKMIGMPLMCCHTPSDNLVSQYLQKIMDRQKPKTLKAVINILRKEPEYKDAMKLNAGPEIWVGKETNKTGKVFVDMTGGTEGSKDIFGRLSQCGVDTILGMHLSPSHLAKIKPEFLNVIIAGHIASDNLGLNLLLDRIEKKEKIEVIASSGFRRYKR